MSHRRVPSPSSRPRRSMLAVPASSMKMMTKACTTDADVVFLDLEDAVSANEKPAARQLAVDAIRNLDWKGNGKTIALRVNGLDTAWTYRDLVDVVEAAGDRLDSVIIPKVGSPADLYAVDVIVSQIAESKGYEPVALEALIETAQGASQLDAIARYNQEVGSRRLEAMHFGAGDYAASVDARTVEIGGLNPDYPGDNGMGSSQDWWRRRAPMASCRWTAHSVISAMRTVILPPQNVRLPLALLGNGRSTPAKFLWPMKSSHPAKKTSAALAVFFKPSMMPQKTARAPFNLKGK